MVVEIKSIGCIEDLKKVPAELGISPDENWLNKVCYSLSTKSGTLAFAHGRKICVLSNKWDKKLQQFQYKIFSSTNVRTDVVELFRSTNNITSILCVPLPNETHQYSTKSTVLIVGFNLGFVLVFNSHGDILASDPGPLEEPVRNILIQNESKHIEEVYVIYKTGVYILQCKHVFRIIEEKDFYTSTFDTRGVMSGRLWKYDESGDKCDSISNAAVVGSKSVGLFDHLMAASYEGGFNAKFKSSSPQQLVVITMGQNPFIGFYYAKEVIVQPVLSDVARVVANKVRNVLPSWLTGGQPAAAPESPKMNVSTDLMSLRYSYSDEHRTTNHIWFAANNRLAAVSDNLGRVLLIDCARNLITRMWKGYRDAQCSFIQVDEKIKRNEDKSKRRKTLYLAIYAPRRSTVDIWNVERGRKLATYPASAHGQLIQQSAYANASGDGGSRASSSATSAFYLNLSDLSMKELTIPFHYALDTSSTKKSKDMHLINQLKSVIREVHDDDDAVRLSEICDLCDSIQTNEMRFKCVNLLSRNRHVTPKIFSIALETFMRNAVDEGSGTDDLDAKSNVIKCNQLIEVLTNYKKLTDFFGDMKELTIDEEFKCTPTADEDSGVENRPDFDDILKAIEKYRNRLSAKKSTKVKIRGEYQNNTFTDFLSIFDCTGDEIRLIEGRVSRFSSVAFDLFDSFIEKSNDLSSFLSKTQQSSLNSTDLLRLFLRYWMEKDISFENRDDVEKHLTIFTIIFNQICELNRENVQYQYNALSPWWQDIRENLLHSPSVFKSLLAAMLCRDLSVHFEKAESNSGEDEAWEEVSKEAAQWSLLIGKLDDVAILSSILSSNPPTSSNIDEAKAIVPLPYDIPDISLVAIFNGGKGIISELVAKWIAATGISPAEFYNNDREAKEATEEPSDESKVEVFPAIKYFRSLRKHFPFSLHRDVILAHIIWEYSRAWYENFSRLEYFSAMLQCLDAFGDPETDLVHGIACRIWNRHIRHAVNASVKITNRIDDDKLNGMNDVLVPEFIAYCDKFIQHLAKSKKRVQIPLKFEELLQDGKVPLAVAATQEDIANSQLISLHLELNKTLLFLSSLNINFKHTVQTLFNEYSQQLFGVEINSRNLIEIPKTDEVVNKQRRHFMRRVINAVVDLIRCDYETTYTVDYEFWMEKVMNLVKTWGLKEEEMLQYLVIQLYSRGWDDVAEVSMKTLSHPSALTKTLLLIVGNRMNEFVKDRPEIYSNIVTVGSLVSPYLESLEGNESKFNETASQTQNDVQIFTERLLELSRVTFRCANEQKNQEELRLAGQLYDACMLIKCKANTKCTENDEN